MKTKFFIQQKFHLATTVHLFDYFELHCIKYISNQNLRVRISKKVYIFFIKIIMKHFLITLETFELVFFVENECELLVKVYISRKSVA